MDKHKPVDANGKDLKVGDWVKVIAVPSNIGNMPNESKEAFSSAVGKTLQIEKFDEIGCLELDFNLKLGILDTIWLEPYLCTRFRRYKKLSRAFLRKQEWSRDFDERHST